MKHTLAIALAAALALPSAASARSSGTSMATGVAIGGAMMLAAGASKSGQGQSPLAACGTEIIQEIKACSTRWTLQECKDDKTPTHVITRTFCRSIEGEAQ